MNLPTNRVNGSRMNRLGVNTNHVVCRDLAHVSGTVRSNSLCGGGRLDEMVSRAGRTNGTLRLLKLLSSNNIRDRVRRLLTLVYVTGIGNLAGVCIRTFLSKHSINPGATLRCVQRLRRNVTRVNMNGVTAIDKHCCTVSHSGH